MTQNKMTQYHKPMTKPTHDLEHTDKRTGIVYTNVGAKTTTQPTQPTQPTAKTTTQPHLDAFLPAAFLKTYFDGESKI
jgi:hypothetical protein